MGIVPLTGCQMYNQFRSTPALNSPVAFTEIPTKEQMVAHLSSQSQQVKQLQSDVKVSVAGLPSLRGTLAVERPHRLRMTAGLLGVSELGIDVGSNQDRFWFWTKVASAGQRPAIYYARHDEYQSSMLQQALPIEPGWVIDSLGLMEFDTNDRIEGPFQRPDGRLELRTYRNVGGQTTFRITVLDRKFGWVLQQAVYDSAGRRLAYANSKEYEHYPEYQVNLPSLIEITAYAPDGSETKFTINASRFRINSIFGDPDKLWNMPSPAHVPQVDLVRLSQGQHNLPGISEGASNIHRFTPHQQQGIANRNVLQHLR